MVGLLNVDPAEAYRKVLRLRQQVADAEIGDIYYHTEPFEVACNLIGEVFPGIDGYRQSYLKIVERYTQPIVDEKPDI